MDETQNKPPLFKKIVSEEFTDNYDIRKLILGIQRHVALIVITIVLFGAFGVLAAYKFLKTFQAESLVVFQQQSSKDTQDIPGGYILTNLSMATTMDMIKLPKNLEAVKAILGLDLSIEAIKGMVDVPTPKDKSKFIRIVARSGSPHLAVDIANTLAKVSVRASQEFEQSQLRSALANYRAHREIARLALVSQLAEIEAFKNENQYFELEPTYASAISEIDELKNRWHEAEENYNGLLVEYQNLKREMDQIPDMVPINRETRDSPLKTRIISLETALAQARARYTKENPRVQLLEEELNALLAKSKNLTPEGDDKLFYEKNELKEKLTVELVHLKGKVRSAQKVKEELARKYSEIQNGLRDIPEKQMALVKMLQEKEMLEEQIKSLNEAVESTQLMINVPKGSIGLYHLAKKAKPWKDRWWAEAFPMIALFFGLGFGVVLAVFLEIQDRKFRTARQLAMSYNIPCLVTIPEMTSLSVKATLFYIRELVEQIEKLKKGDKFTVSLTSSMSGEGKSCLAFYLANYYRDLGKKVLLFECDYRRNPFVLPSNPTGENLFEEMITPGQPDRLRITKEDPGMKEFLKSEKMQKRWAELKSKYDVIIVDAPGLIQDDYANNLSLYTDLTFFVIGSSQMKKHAIDEALTVLDNSEVRPAGIILNRINPLYIDDERIKLEMQRRGW